MGKKLRKKKRNRRHSRDCEKTKLADHLSIHNDAVESNTEQKHDYISSLPDEMLSKSNTEQKHDYISSLPDEMLSESNTEQQHDYISSLPDEILSHIISFLPFKFALTTSILSTRWRNFWSTDCVDQSDEKSMARHGSIENFCTVLTEFLEIYLELELHRPQTLRFRFSQSKIILVTIEKDNELYLDFSKGQQEMTSHFNWYLNLDFRHCPTINMLHTVKTLYLRSVSHLTKVMISTLIKNCHQLESLIISGCRGLGALHIDDKHRLQSLKVVDCPELQILQVYAYSLKSFEFRGLLPWFFMNHVPYLIDCLLDFKNGPAYSPFSCENVLSLLLALKDAKILTLSGWFFEVPIPRWLPSAGTIFERDDFHFYSLKELSWIDSSMNSYKMDAMVSFLKICPSLEKISIHIDPMCYHVPSSLSWWAKQERCFWKDYTNRVAPNVRLNQLKFVKLTGYTDEVEIISIIDRLLTDISGVHEPMIITTSSEKGTRRVVKKPLNQPSQQWKGCQGRTEHQNQQVNYFYEFVEDEGSVLSDFVDEGFLKEFMDLLSFQ